MRTALIGMSVAAAALSFAMLAPAKERGAQERVCGVPISEVFGLSDAALDACAENGGVVERAWRGMAYWASATADDASADEMRRRGRLLVEEGARGGYGPAQNELGLAYLEGRHGVEVDFEQARRWLEAATENGDEIAPLNLARMHYTGMGVAASEGEAERLLQVSADRGYGPAMCSLAELIERRGGAGNAARAAAWRRSATSSSGIYGRCMNSDLIAELRSDEPDSIGIEDILRGLFGRRPMERAEDEIDI